MDSQTYLHHMAQNLVPSYLEKINLENNPYLNK